MNRLTTLAGGRDLLAHIDDPDWRIFDCRHDLSNPLHGRNAYARGHVPGAHFLHLDDDLSGPKSGSNGRHPLPAPHWLAARLAANGLNAGDQVIAYDDSGGTFAVRLWWMLRWLGHERVAVLDGGLAAWKRAGGTLTTEAPAAGQGNFTPRTHNDMRVEAEFVRSRLGDAGTLVVDARAPERYSGRTEPLDPVGGHIPGAVNRFYMENLDDLQCFRPADELRAEFAGLIGKREPGDIVHSCGSGVTACHNVLAMEIAGLKGSRLYGGSWSEWCADPTRPVATGD
jgi:thiosulfate/3-mercaptopyruvate sulfurtransferase